MTVAHFVRIAVFLSRCYAEADVPAIGPLLAVGEAIGYSCAASPSAPSSAGAALIAIL